MKCFLIFNIDPLFQILKVDLNKEEISVIWKYLVHFFNFQAMLGYSKESLTWFLFPYWADVFLR